MKFQLVSDIHLESYNELPDMKEFIIPKAPNLILAGDICFIKHKLFTPFFERLSKMFKRIIYVLGNHEYYYFLNYKMDTILSMETLLRNKLSPFKNIHVLQKSSLIIDNIVILGCTLWSYLSKKDFVSGMQILSQSSFVKHRNQVLLRPTITNKIHFDHKAWLTESLEKYKNRKVIVVTHYLPTLEAIDNKFSFFNKAYYSNCDDLVERANAWCAGHTHTQKIIHVGETPLYINPIGLPHEKQKEPQNMVFLI